MAARCPAWTTAAVILRQSSHCLATTSRPSLSLPARRVRLQTLRARVSRSGRRSRSLGDTYFQEYEDALEGMDLAKALELLDAARPDASGARAQEEGEVVVMALPSGTPSVSPGQQQFLRLLNTCLSTSDLTLVAKAYNWLNVRGLLPNFGRYKDRASEGERVVTPAVLMAATGLEASKLSPKKWGLSGVSATVLFASLALFSFAVDNHLEIRPTILLLMSLGLADAIYLGGTGYGQVLSLFPAYRERILVHEAGHVLAAYFLGCPVRGVILDAMQALKMGIQGQAGTQFWDSSLEEELKQNRITSASLDRYCIVIFAGIAAEAMVYGEAEGGESDENMFKAVVSQLKPSWSPAQMSNQARWAVIQALRILKEQRAAHEAVVEALRRNLSLASVIRALEAAAV